jgi:hypothetical protein
MALLNKVKLEARLFKEFIMAKKDDYLEGYGQGLKRGKEGPVMGPINKALDAALGNPHESARRGLEQGYAEMKAAKKIESEKGMKKGGAVKKMATGGKVSQLAKANGIAVRGKTRGKIC